MSRNDILLFLVLPYLLYLLMFIGPILAAKISPELAGFDRTWITKTRSEIIWFFLLPLIALVVDAIIRSLSKQLGIPLTRTILYESSLHTNAIFFIAVILLTAFIAPVVEEIFWRGYVQDRLGRVLGPRIALFTQAIAFATLHFRPVGGFVSVFAYGLIAGLWRYRRKSLLPIIIAHIIINSPYCARLWYNRAELAKINVKTDYVSQFKEISRPADYDPNDNAAGYYEKAFELSIDQPEQLTDLKAWPEDLPNDKQVLLEDWVSTNGDALEQLKQGAQKPYYWLEHKGSSMWDVIIPSLAQARSLAYAICSRAKLNAVQGDFRVAFSDLLVCYRFGKHFTGPKTLVDQLVGIGIRELTLQSGFQILDKVKPTPDLLKDFQLQLESFSDRQSYVIDFTAEKLLVYDNIQRIFTDDGKGDGYIPKVTADVMNEPPPYLRLLSHGDITGKQKSGWEKLQRRKTTELADEIYEYFSGVVHKTPWQLYNDGKAIEKVIEEMTKDNPFLRMFMPAVGRVMEISFRGKIRTEALITTLALLRYEAEKDQLPENLDQLVATGYLKKLPVDPFSGRILIYKRIDDDFTLYSFGADFDDDGGVRSKWGEGEQGGDQVFWPVSRKQK